MKNRTVRVEYIRQGVAGHLFKVTFLSQADGKPRVEVGHWPIHEGLALAQLVQDWIVDGKRPM